MIQIPLCGRRGLDTLGAAEKLVIGALRLWKMRRAGRLATLPELHQRLVSVGGAMLAVPLDDFFKQIAAWRNCPHQSRLRYSDQLICDEVATLDLLRGADGRYAELPAIGSTWNAASLRTLSAWVLGRQFNTELGLRFGMSASLRHQPVGDPLEKPSACTPPKEGHIGRAKDASMADLTPKPSRATIED